MATDQQIRDGVSNRDMAERLIRQRKEATPEIIALARTLYGIERHGNPDYYAEAGVEEIAAIYISVVTSLIPFRQRVLSEIEAL